MSVFINQPTAHCRISSAIPWMHNAHVQQSPCFTIRTPRRKTSPAAPFNAEYQTHALRASTHASSINFPNGMMRSKHNLGSKDGIMPNGRALGRNIPREGTAMRRVVKQYGTNTIEEQDWLSCRSAQTWRRPFRRAPVVLVGWPVDWQIRLGGCARCHARCATVAGGLSFDLCAAMRHFALHGASG